MHPSCLKLLLNQLSVSDLGIIQATLSLHIKGLKACIANRNYGTYSEEAFKQDLAMSEYIVEYAIKSLNRRGIAPSGA